MKKPPPSFQFRIRRGLEGIDVNLWDPHDAQRAANVIASFYLSTWGDPEMPHNWEAKDRANESWFIAMEAMSGKVLPNTLESLNLTYSIFGVARATTHQLVRTRVGAVFGQQGGRDNNWSEFNLKLPETWFRTGNHLIRQRAEDLQIQMNSLYNFALKSGIPFQDARYVLPMGLQTSLVASYNLLALKSLANRRLCNRMMWETNFIVRWMADLAVFQYPWIGRNLRSGCEQRGVCESVSPMFPPACWSTKPMGSAAQLAVDNKTLETQVKGNGYDFLSTANGNYYHFDEIDQRRLKLELMDDSLAVSLVDGKSVLAQKDADGLWRRA